MIKWIFVIIISILFIGIFEINYAEAQPLEDPNIIFIMTDDLSNFELKLLLENDLMPNFENYFVSNGTYFEKSYVANPVCCPSRAIALTGQYSHNNDVFANDKVDRNGIIFNGGVSALDDSITIATVLDDHGYNTAFVGKYLNLYGTQNNYFIPPGWDEWSANVEHDLLILYNYTIIDNDRIIKNVPKYRTFFENDKIIELINDFSQQEKPFFINYWPIVPHFTNFGLKCDVNYLDGKKHRFWSVRVPQTYIDSVKNIPINHPPSFNEDDVSDKPVWKNPSKFEENATECIDAVIRPKLASMIPIDELIGNMIEALENKGELENTIIIFTSDNGFLFGEHRTFNKSKPFEEAISVPLYFYGYKIPKNLTISSLVNSVDWAPTIADYAGTSLPISDGMSLKPLIEDPTTPWRLQTLIEGAFEARFTFYLITDGVNVLIDYMRYLPSFYNLTADPFQLKNLYPCKDDLCLLKFNKLNNTLQSLKTCSMDSCRQLETQKIPGWIKNNANWWAANQIEDSDFLQGIQYLIQQDIMQISETSVPVTGDGSQDIPGWVKNNADWWSQGLISDDTFVKGIQYLVEKGIIRIS